MAVRQSAGNATGLPGLHAVGVLLPFFWIADRSSPLDTLPQDLGHFLTLYFTSSTDQLDPVFIRLNPLSAFTWANP